MLEELKEEAIIEKVGGRFKLSTLIQKRIVQLKQGSRPLVDMQADNMMELVLQEILQDKITLDTDNQVHTPEGETVVTDVPDINPLEL
ncbi:MAG: DNA-directed RNA polymerase subunit omega [Planctomycetaceae bacterium]|jgi:DNA-directed RNA polymerase subunit omega|nr:DNA-directed RNA polymerase subunit omega [Planctomycetaceae bacterium]